MNWEHRKNQLRARLAKEMSGPKQTIKSREQLEAEAVAYWTPDQSDRPSGMSDLRYKYMLEAEQARERWAELDPKGPNSASRRRMVPKCDMSEGKDTILPKCDIPTGERIGIRRCQICGKEFSSTRADAVLCSARCRKRASRARVK